MRTVEINKEPVELYKILKFEGLTATGGFDKCPGPVWYGSGYRWKSGNWVLTLPIRKLASKCSQFLQVPYSKSR